MLALVLPAKKYARQFILGTVWMANISQVELFLWLLFTSVQNLLWDLKKERKKKSMPNPEFCGGKKLKIKRVGRKVYEIWICKSYDPVLSSVTRESPYPMLRDRFASSEPSKMSDLVYISNLEKLRNCYTVYRCSKFGMVRNVFTVVSFNRLLHMKLFTKLPSTWCLRMSDETLSC